MSVISGFSGPLMSHSVSSLPPADRRELLSWALYDFANSGYTTVVLTTIYSAYFVAVVAGGVPGLEAGAGTFIWTLAVSLANLVVLVSAPIVGAMADHRATKKRFLLMTTVGCVAATALLAAVGPGDVWLGAVLLVLSAVFYYTGENLVAAFLPEIAVSARMGRLSGYAWSLGYAGGLLTLAICLGYITWAKGQGQVESQFVPVTLLITAAIFALAATPVFLWLRERATPSPTGRVSYLRQAYGRLRRTLAEAARHRDLFHFLVALVVYQSGISTVIVLTAIYAREVAGFDSQSLVVLVMVVNVTAAVGALVFGPLQDRFGSVPMLASTLIVWCVAIFLAYGAEGQGDIWLAGNLIGLAMGASQAGGRALIGKFTPQGRSAEFFGLWGMINRTAAILGPLSYGLINYLSGGDHRLAILSVLVFFIVGLVILLGVNEKRGVSAAEAGDA